MGILGSGAKSGKILLVRSPPNLLQVCCHRVVLASGSRWVTLESSRLGQGRGIYVAAIALREKLLTVIFNYLLGAICPKFQV